MSPPSEAAFSRLFRELDEAERLAFVAELWAARGWETTVRNGAVVAADGGAERIRIVDPGRFGTDVPDDADVLVTTADREALRTRTEDGGCRYVPPTGLREQLLYGVERDDAAALFEATFGQPLDAESHVAPPLPRRLRQAASDLRNRSRDRFESVPVSVSVLVVVLLVSAVAAGGVYGPNGDTGVGDEATTVASGAADAGAGTDESTEAGEPDLPPGIVESGISDRSALVRAHQQEVTGRQRTLRVAADGPPDAEFMSGRIAWNYTARVQRTAHYRFEANDTYPAEESTGTDVPLTVRTDVFANAGVNYRQRVTPTETTYLRYPTEAAGDASKFADEVGEFLRTYLRGQQTAVECFEGTGYRGAHCHLYMGGAPPSFPNAEGYRVSATVEKSGVVSSFEVSYTLPDADGDGSRELVRFEFAYEGFGETTVSQPEWLPEAKNATGESSSA